MEPITMEMNDTCKQNIHLCQLEEKSEIDKLINNDCFFSDFNDDNDSNVFDFDNLTALHVDYFENYNMKMLHHMANYYNIPKRKLKKDELIELIILFENDKSNMEIVYNRKRLWHYITELKTDSYFGKFVNFD